MAGQNTRGRILEFRNKWCFDLFWRIDFQFVKPFVTKTTFAILDAGILCTSFIIRRLLFQSLNLNVLSNYFWGAVTSKDGIAAQGNTMREEPGLENGVGGPSKGLEILG